MKNLQYTRPETGTESRFQRTQMLIGKKSMGLLMESRVAVFGMGGVGGYAVEALARSGVGALDLVDNDTVSLSNINRQIIATESTLGKFKVDVAADRVRDINPECRVTVHRKFFLSENANEFNFSDYDYVVDAVDAVSAKVALAECAYRAGTPIISSMGAGNKLDPTAFEVADIFETSMDPLAKIMRHELKRRGIRRLKVVYSRERPLKPVEDPTQGDTDDYLKYVAEGKHEGEKRYSERAAEKALDVFAGTISRTSDMTEESAERALDDFAASADRRITYIRPERRSTPGSFSFVPSAVGLIIAGEVVRDLIGI